MDDSGDISLAAHQRLIRVVVFTALVGWHDALNAKAFQQQQAAAQGISTALVLLNGAFVATIVIAVFAFLISSSTPAVYGNHSPQPIISSPASSRSRDAHH